MITGVFLTDARLEFLCYEHPSPADGTHMAKSNDDNDNSIAVGIGLLVTAAVVIFALAEQQGWLEDAAVAATSAPDRVEPPSARQDRRRELRRARERRANRGPRLRRRRPGPGPGPAPTSRPGRP
jgi:hypothetical protein